MPLTRRLFLGLAGSLAVSSPAAAREGAAPFLAADALDLTALLPPPPPDDAAETRRDLAELLVIQNRRTAEDVERARADRRERVWRFADVLGDGFRRRALPRADGFFERVVDTVDAVVDPAKDRWNRHRPYEVSREVVPVLRPSRSASYP